MGQYFIIANLDKKEIIKPELLKLWEILANNYIRLLGFLLATKNPDGIGSTQFFYNKEQKEEAIKHFRKHKIAYEVHELEPNSGYVMPYFKYLGWWCGDRIAIIGDYHNQKELPSFEEVSTWKDITEAAAKEYNFFIEIEEYKIGKTKAIMPDMLVSSNKIEMDKKTIL
jgi:hypothetical protein